MVKQRVEAKSDTGKGVRKTEAKRGGMELDLGEVCAQMFPY